MLSFCGEESMTICSAVLIQYQGVTDGRTDRRTYRIAISISRVSVLTRDNKVTRFYGSRCRPIRKKSLFAPTHFTAGVADL